MRSVFHFVLSFILITTQECCLLLWQWVGFILPFMSGAVSWVVSELIGAKFPTFSNGVLAPYSLGSKRSLDGLFLNPVLGSEFSLQL